jgi:dienelactone hydrolase
MKRLAKERCVERNKTGRRLSALAVCALMMLTAFGCKTADNIPGDITAPPTESTQPVTEKLEVMDLYEDGYNNNMIVGFDEYGRTVPAAAGKKDKRDVGIFYFLWLGQPQSSDIYDVSKIIAEQGQDIVFHEEGGKISPNGQAHWWAEPLYGYYNSVDKWVIRKHLEMLTEAGVDFLIFDTTNCLLYSEVAKKIMKMSQELRDEGWDAPQVCFYTHSRSIDTIKQIYNTYYKKGNYPDSWYRIDGRPMIIGYTSAEKDILEAESRGETTYKPSDLSQELQDFFYVKEACWPNDEHNDNSFPYTEWVYPQPLNGNTMNVSVATHPMVPFSFSLTHENWCNWGRGYDINTGENKHEDIYRGTFFQSEWETVFASDPQPEILMVTGWNEWIAYKQPYGGEYMLCDNVDMEYSRDIEPMQGGYEDAYFIQMITNIRKYKYNDSDGVIADNVYKTIDLNGSDAQWDEVKAVYRHVGTVNDKRDAYGAAKTVHYSLPAADNNILSVKLTNDAENLYFRIECADPVKVTDNANWMNLFIGTGTPAQKGWESYEYVIGRSRDAASGTAAIEQLSADFTGKPAGDATYAVNDKTVIYSVPMAAIGIDTNSVASALRIYFKVADGVDGAEEIMNYYVSGRCLPMGRLSYEYKFVLPSGQSGSNTGTDPVSTNTAEVINTATATERPTPTPTPSPKPTTVPDPSTVTLTIEDFNAISDPIKELRPLDLSGFGITHPEFSFEEEYAQEGLALVNTLSASTWCQAFELTGKRLNVFKEAQPEYYLRIWVVTPDITSVGLSFCLGTGGGSKRSYIDASKAIVTDVSGEVIECDTGNDTSDAGDDSSIRIPDGFEGYVALPLSELIPWNNYEGITDLAKVNYLKIDARPSVACDGDRYILDALCLSDSPVGELRPGGSGSHGDQPDQQTFATKNEELDYMFSELLNKEATFQYCPEYDPAGYPNVKAIWLDGVSFGGKATKVFAYIGFPEGASADNKVPAIVLQHGGGGYAYPNWVKLWNDRGYAAIAVGNTGYFPAAQGITDFYGAASWTRSVPKDVLSSDPRIMPPDNDGMYSSTGSVDRMWMYHAVAQTILANNLLRADKRVDPDRIGLTGISWGGVITSIAIGYDTRFAFAIPVYGSGYLNEAHSWMKDNFNSKGTRELWEPSLKFNDVRTPVLWLCWANDNCFSINSNSKSFVETNGSVLSVIQNWNHGHIEGWSRPEIYRFADWAVKGGKPLATFETLPGSSRDVSFRISVPSDADSVKARVCYIDEPLSYSPNGRLHIAGQDTIDQEWHFVNCSVSGNTISVRLPDDAVSYYVELSVTCGGTTFTTSSPLTDVK